MPVPRRVESLNAAPAAPTLSLAVVLTDNTKNAIKYASVNQRGNAGLAMAHMFTNPHEHDVQMLPKEQPINTMVELLTTNFKSVVKAASLNEAKELHTDLIAMVDFYQEFPFGLARKGFANMVMEGYMQIEETLLLLDPSGEQVGKITAVARRQAAEADKVPLYRQFNVGPFVWVYRDLQDDEMFRFQAALSASDELKAYAKNRRPAPAAAPAAPETAQSDVDAPTYKKSEDAAKFALVIGIDGYQNLPAAGDAERDAQSVRRHLLALGYPDRNVVLLTGREAGKSGIEKYVESWLPRNVDENSRVLVYFAGHGGPDAATGQAYLMPWDADAKFVDSTSYPVKKLYTTLAALKAKRVVVAFDAGFSGAGGRSVIAQGARPLMTHVDENLPQSEKLVVLTAASGDELAGRAAGQSHGLFTYELLKSLNDHDGDLSLKTLYDSLKPKVQDAARRDNRDQTPRLLPAGGSFEDAL